MKIDDIVQNRATSLDILQRKTSEKADKNAKTQANKPDAFSVKLSSALEQMKSTASLENDDARRDKVAAIRKQLASGTYNISGKDVASKILNAIKE
ncbi:MAG: flagellar biosynthesis anti-sigma factor FlgM [Deltaproteobacteria bacterium]